MIQLDVLLVLLDPGPNGTIDLFNVDIPIARDAVTASNFQAKVIFDGQEETGDLLRGRPTVLLSR
jgi:hypothetical protein